MFTFDIFTDSAANLPDETIAKYGITVVPYTVLVNGKERLCYDPAVPTTEAAKAFYAEMRAGADIKTSLVSEQAFIDALTPTLQAGRDALLITISSGVSGSFNQAVQARETLLQQFPQRKIRICDSANASLGEGLLVLKAAVLRDANNSLDACAEYVTRNAYKMNSYFSVADLKYLRRGGRISATLAIAGAILNIKPILRADGSSNAKIAFFGKAHGRKKALAALVDAYEKNADGLGPIAIAHADCEEDAQFLAEMLREKGATDIIMECYDICTGSHAGPGTVALFFSGKDRRVAEMPRVIAATL